VREGVRQTLPGQDLPREGTPWEAIHLVPRLHESGRCASAQFPTRNLLQEHSWTNTPRRNARLTCKCPSLASAAQRNFLQSLVHFRALVSNAVWPLAQDRADTNGLWAHLDSMIAPVQGTPRPSTSHPTLEATQGQILRQYPTDATRSWWRLHWID